MDGMMTAVTEAGRDLRRIRKMVSFNFWEEPLAKKAAAGFAGRYETDNVRIFF